MPGLNDNLSFISDIYGQDIVPVEAASHWRAGEYLKEPGAPAEPGGGRRVFRGDAGRMVLDFRRGAWARDSLVRGGGAGGADWGGGICGWSGG